MKEFIPIFDGNVEDGKLRLWHPEQFRGYLYSLRGRVSVVVRKWKNKRAIKQNSLYWAYLRMIEDETGNPSEYLHEYFKKTLLPCKEMVMFGKRIEMPASTTELSTIEFAKYIKKIEIETGIMLPNTNKIDVN